MKKAQSYVKTNGTLKEIADAWVKKDGAWQWRLMWFERQAGKWQEVLTLNKPSIPLSITVPTVVHMKENIIVSWGASEGAIRYHLEQSIDGGSFEEVYQGTNRTFTDTAELEWETSRYRVRAYNNAGYSDYRTSSVVNILGIRIPKGTIIAWSGTADTIPSGWYLCDGNNGTPNLADRFVMGGTESGAIGGGGNHTHTIANGGEHAHVINSATHTHSSSGSSGKIVAESPWGGLSMSGGHVHTVSAGGAHEHSMLVVSDEPPYYALAYIMKG